MTSDRPTDDAAADRTGPWLDGLAGRPGSGPDHGEGSRIRAALAPVPRDSVAARWNDIEARAQSAAATQGGVQRAAAANDARPWRRLAWAAALVLGVGLAALLVPQGPDGGLRGVGQPPAPGPRWLVDRPAEAATALATELRALGAEVNVTQEGDALVLDIRAPAAATAPVNARLVALETGLGADGRVQLRVVPAR